MEIEDSLRQYISHYAKYGAVSRVIGLIKAKRENFKYSTNQLYQLAFEQAVAANMVAQVEKLITEASLNQINIAIDQKTQQWIEASKKSLAQSVRQYEQQIDKFKTQKNNLSIRQQLIEFGLLFLNAGDMNAAQTQLEKALNYSANDMNPIDILIPLFRALFHQKNYDQLNVYYLKYSKFFAPGQIGDLNINQIHVIMLLAFVATHNFNGFCNIITSNLIDLDNWTEDLHEFAQLADIGTYLVLIILAQKPRDEIITIYKHPLTKTLLESNQKASEVLTNYIGMQFDHMLQMLRTLDVEYDPFIQTSVNSHMESITNKIIITYLQSFSKISLSQIAKDLALNEQTCLIVILDMIHQNKINFLYDPIDRQLVMKNTPARKRYKLYKKAIKVIKNYIHQKYLLLFRNQANKIQHEGRMKMMDMYAPMEELMKAQMGL